MLKTIIVNHLEIKVSPDGLIYRSDGSEILQTRSNRRRKSPFYYVSINGKWMLVHRLVAMAYIPNPAGYKLVMHMDTNTTNNHFLNLNWGHQASIAQNMKVVGRVYNSWQTKRPNSKIRPKDIKNVLRLIKAGKSLALIGRMYKTSGMSIHRIKVKYLDKEIL